MRRAYLEKLQELAEIASAQDLPKFVDLFRKVQKLSRRLKAE